MTDDLLDLVGLGAGDLATIYRPLFYRAGSIVRVDPANGSAHFHAVVGDDVIGLGGDLSAVYAANAAAGLVLNAGTVEDYLAFALSVCDGVRLVWQPRLTYAGDDGFMLDAMLLCDEDELEVCFQIALGGRITVFRDDA